MQGKERILCAREIQNSMKDSVHKLLADIIDDYKLPYFEITREAIRNTLTGSEFIFTGLRHNIHSIKSMKGITKVWIEEASTASQEILDLLLPTIRESGSEVWATFNRDEELDPIYTTFCVNAENDDDVFYKHTTWRDNPFFPEVLDKQRLRDKKLDYDKYLHIWEGEPRQQGEEAIIRRDRVMGAMNRQQDAVGGIEIGVDVARQGKDRSQLYKRKGYVIIDSKTFAYNKIDELVDYVMEFADYDKDVSIKVDDTGVGGGCTDYLRRYGYRVQAINNGATAKDPDKYPNAISEMWFEINNLMDKISIPNDNDLMHELTTRQKEYTTDARRRVESKEKYKKRGNISPDKADALLLTFYNNENFGDFKTIENRKRKKPILDKW